MVTSRSHSSDGGSEATFRDAADTPFTRRAACKALGMVLTAPLAACWDPDPPIPNQRPIADAGDALTTHVSGTVTLDGSHSHDPNGDSLSYRWTLTTRPIGSVAALTGATSANPTFAADVAGDYVATLTVNDGKTDSAQPATVRITYSPAYTLRGLGFSPYIDGQDPNLGSTVDATQISLRLEFIRRYSRTIRTFGSTHGLEAIPALAKAMGLDVVAGAWIGTDATANDSELASLIGNANLCKALIVGSEVLLRGDQSEDALLDYIARVKAAAPLIAVGYADTHSTLLAHPRVLAAVDVVYANYYPYWEGIALDLAAAAIQAQHARVVAAAAGKPVIVGETGWPSAGDTIGNAVPSPDNAAAFFANFVSWAEATNTDYFYFEAFNEAWKTAEGPQGTHWGLWTSDGHLKPGMQPVFDGTRVADNWTPSLEITHVPAYGSTENLTGRVLHAVPSDYNVVVYINVAGGWWIKPYDTAPLTSIGSDGNWTADVTTGGDDVHATQIIVFLVPTTYLPPRLLGSADPPIDLIKTAIATHTNSRG